jgi:hypothetical protein
MLANVQMVLGYMSDKLQKIEKHEDGSNSNNHDVHGVGKGECTMIVRLKTEKTMIVKLKGMWRLTMVIFGWMMMTLVIEFFRLIFRTEGKSSLT